MTIARRWVAASALFAAGAFCAGGNAGPASTSFNRPADVKAITDIETAIAGELDADKLLANFEPGATVADFALPGWYEGRKQIYAAYKPQLDAVSAIKFRMDEINVATDGRFACAALLIHFDARMKNKSAFAMSVRELDAFEKRGGRWRIVQQHVSVPVDQKTGSGLMNAQLVARGPLALDGRSFARGAAVETSDGNGIRSWLVSNIVPTTVDGAMQSYGPGDDVILFDVASTRETRGLGELRSYLEPALAGTRDIEYKIASFHAASDGAFGVQLSKLDLKIDMKNGTTNYMSFRQSDCLRRVGGKWHSFFEMGSFPIDPKTGKAVMSDSAAFK